MLFAFSELTFVSTFHHASGDLTGLSNRHGNRAEGPPILDGKIVALDDDGGPIFRNLLRSGAAGLRCARPASDKWSGPARAQVSRRFVPAGQLLWSEPSSKVTLSGSEQLSGI